MENEKISVSKKSNLQDLIKRTNEELSNFCQSIVAAKSFDYKDNKIAAFAEKVLNKYNYSLIRINEDSLSIQKSIWINANDFIDLKKYEENLNTYAITCSHVDFSIILDAAKENVAHDVQSFASNAFELINTAMGNYVFYTENVIIHNFNFDDSDNSLSVQLELIIDVQ